MRFWRAPCLLTSSCSRAKERREAKVPKRGWQLRREKKKGAVNLQPDERKSTAHAQQTRKATRAAMKRECPNLYSRGVKDAPLRCISASSGGMVQRPPLRSSWATRDPLYRCLPASVRSGKASAVSGTIRVDGAGIAKGSLEVTRKTHLASSRLRGVVCRLQLSGAGRIGPCSLG